MKLSRVDQFGRIVRLAQARKTYASVAENIDPKSDILTALGSMAESMAKIAEANGQDGVGAEEIEAAIEQLAAKGFRVEPSSEYFEANAAVIEEMMKTAGVWDSLGTGLQWGAGQVGRGAQWLQQAPQAAQQALQKGWQTAKDVAGQATALPGKGLEYVKEKAQDVQVGLFEKSKQQLTQSLQQARNSFKTVQDVLAGKSNRINLATLRQFSTAMNALLNAATTMHARTREHVRPGAIGAPAGARSVSPAAAPGTAAAPAAAPAQPDMSSAMGQAAARKGTMVSVAGFKKA